MASDTLSIEDNRNRQRYEIEIRDGAIPAAALKRIRVAEADPGLLSYDPALVNTAVCQSKITSIDAGQGQLRYRGYPVEQLAERCAYSEVVYLLLQGELPTRAQLKSWTEEIKAQMILPNDIKRLIQSFRRDANPMGMLVSAVAALSTWYPEAARVEDPRVRKLQIHRLIGSMATIAGYAYLHNRGLSLSSPDNNGGYIRHLLTLMFRTSESSDQPGSAAERALEMLFILHADHEQNCSTSAMRSVGSAHADPYLCTAAAAAALSGTLHGAANTLVWRMLREIGSKQAVPDYIRRVKLGEVPLLGFQHSVYEYYDPRARLIKQVALEVLELSREEALLGIALELERIVLEDDYFVARKLYPKVEFYSGIVYEAIGFPVEMFPVLFAVARTGGWLAHWEEMLQDPEQKMMRPRQLYLGPKARAFLPIESRSR
jgi:citrate synthase